MSLPTERDCQLPRQSVRVRGPAAPRRRFESGPVGEAHSHVYRGGQDDVLATGRVLIDDRAGDSFEGDARDVELRTLPGLYWHRITEESGRNFFEDTWKVAPEADRIGYRFRGGRPLEFVPRKQPFGAGSDPSNIVDACYPYGSIQVPGGSEPIVLHRDAVSGGGYMMVGTVISADMDLIGQLQPHTSAKFVKVDMNGAIQARQDRRSLLDQIRVVLG